MPKPLVSVVIPVFNGADYLREAVDSVLNQTYPNIEVIVVNDGSDDDGLTEQIMNSYGSKICCYKKENGGVASALNMGIKRMHGEYFSWLSHDDIFYPEKIEKQVELIQREGVLVTACSYHIFMDSGRSVPVPIVKFYQENDLNKGVFSVINGIIQFGGLLFHRKIFVNYGYFNEMLMTTQDYEFLFRILRKEKCKYTNEILYGIRYHANQGSRTNLDVDRERDELHSMFLSELTEEEHCLLYGCSYKYYFHMLMRIWPLDSMVKSYPMVLRRLKEYREDCEEDKTEIVNTVWIYGAGIYGRRLLFQLRCYGIEVKGFLDSNEKLHGNFIDGIICLPLKNMKDMAEPIIIASLYREEIYDLLVQNGNEILMFKEDIEKKLMQSPPKWEKIKDVIVFYERNGWHNRAG